VRGLQAFGWIDGKTIAIEYRYAEGRNDRLPALIAELQRLRVDVIVTSVTNDTLEAKKWRPESCKAWRARAAMLPAFRK
jgi:putative tryptophan/tyrosine transport system substrate-binding protein